MLQEGDLGIGTVGRIKIVYECEFAFGSDAENGPVAKSSATLGRTVEIAVSRFYQTTNRKRTAGVGEGVKHCKHPVACDFEGDATAIVDAAPFPTLARCAIKAPVGTLDKGVEGIPAMRAIERIQGSDLTLARDLEHGARPVRPA